MKVKDRLFNFLKTITLPVAIYLVFWGISKMTGQTFFLSQAGTMSILKNTIMIAILSYGVFYNLNSWRFDFSVGAVWLVAGIISFNLAAIYSLNPWIMLLIAMLTGTILALTVGLLYLFLKVPTIVVSLGMLLIYESISTIVFDGAGITISRYPKINIFGDIKIMLLIFIVIFSLIYVLNNYTSFGYRMRALATGQRVAVKMGINEKKNVLVCWGLSGALAGLAVIFKIVSVGVLTPQTNFGTAAVFADSLLPCFLGAFLGRYSENTTGVLVATLSIQILKVGLNGLQIDPNLQNIFNILFLLLFVVYSSMKQEIQLNLSLKKRAKKVLEGGI